MDVIFIGEEPPDSYAKAICLDGPTPREPGAESWHADALTLLAELAYDGVVFVPRWRGKTQDAGPAEIYEWLERCHHLADCILFWLPRDMRTRPGLGTNVNWGAWQTSGKVVFGAPPEAEHVAYLRHHALKLGVPVADSLRGVVELAVSAVGAGARRRDGEREVPLHVWRTEAFQDWYRAQRAAGNTLQRAQLLWTFRARQNRDLAFFWALHVGVWVAAEQRSKDNEVVIGRPRIATLVMYRPAARLEATEIVLVREFRSPAQTEDGYIRELPGGSSFHAVTDDLALAVEEGWEETGLRIDPARVRVHGTRQVAGTTTSHTATVSSVELHPDELERLRAQREPRGVVADSERTYVEVTTFGEILASPRVDWATLGMVSSVIGWLAARAE